MSRGALVGAYERDNFGDLLFLALTRKYLTGHESTATAPFRARLPDTYDDLPGFAGARPAIEICSYEDHFQKEILNFVWVVGGETGGTSMSDAHRMASPVNAEYRADAASQSASPYLPRPTRYEATTTVPYVVNSVGVSAIAGLHGARRTEALTALREASFLSVRENTSSLALRRERIPHVVAPDLVHTLPIHFQPDGDPQRDIALVQSKESLIRRVGVEHFARGIADSKSLMSYSVRLFSAGEAQGHDSTKLLHEVADQILRVRPGATVSVSSAVSALDKASEIARAGLWVGTSLHGYIISTAFSVPRVGLWLPKLRQYSDSWGVPFPSNAKLSQLESAVSAARLSHRRNPGAKIADILALRADQNMRHAVETATSTIEHSRVQPNPSSENRSSRAIRSYAALRKRAWSSESHARSLVARALKTGPFDPKTYE